MKFTNKRNQPRTQTEYCSLQARRRDNCRCQSNFKRSNLLNDFFPNIGKKLAWNFLVTRSLTVIVIFSYCEKKVYLTWQDT